ncbi:hypothetical protein WHR41_02043 [Cladosporium halotolerans]|uniref:Chitin-binding type-4 domain-containing protein n=1 Tax=Cladosporium halotolerans TaxID=1052096 RepID=A0AB34L0U2_9PEZI
MKNTGSNILASASMLALASAHGFITSPSPRMPGDAMAAACGQQMYYNQQGDNYGNVQGELQVAQDDYDAAACDVWLCKGYKYADNKDNVQQWTVGQDVPISVDIRAPHTGVANVSVVSTSSGQVIGEALKSWDVYASNSATIPDDQKEFSVTIPDVGSDCSSPGDCVLQWFWDAADINQTYESCIDFTVGGGSGSGSSGSGSSSGNSSSAPASSAAAPAQTKVQAVSSVASSAPAATSAAASGSEEADPTCSVVYVTASAAAAAEETAPARRHRRSARGFGRRHH